MLGFSSAKLCLIAAAVVLASAATSAAEPFPSKMVRIIVPYAPGGSIDLVARVLAKNIQDSVGQTVIVENKPGAGGKIGDDYVASARPDGLTLLIDDVTRPVLTTLTNPDVAPNEMLEAFALAGMLGYSPIILTAAPALSRVADRDGQGRTGQVQLRLARPRHAVARGECADRSSVRARRCARALPGRRGDADGCR
jgi:tripartite-type tricarboxylate transporter receptor subunit TctC